MIRIVADSTCDLSRELIEQHNIEILPLHIMLGDKEYLDGINVTPSDLYKWSDENKSTPHTSAPSISDAISLFEKVMVNGDEIIAFAISSSMSASCETMQIAAQNLDACDRISVIDSANLSTGIGLLVVEAATMAEQGMARDLIVQQIEKLKPNVRASFVVDTLTYLHRGGRCSSVAALAGGALKLHPKIVVENGAMSATKKYRGKYSNIVLEYVKDMEPSLKKAKPDRIFITHSGMDPDIVDSVRNYLRELNIFNEVIETRAGSVISSHCGPGTLGALFIVQEES